MTTLHGDCLETQNLLRHRKLTQSFKTGSRQPASACSPQTLLITVLKNAIHLSNLARLLGRLELTRVPTLVIDDEADQAGLNTGVNQGTESPTHRELRNVRTALPHHTYLGYNRYPPGSALD